jgi:hypothetical protein
MKKKIGASQTEQKEKALTDPKCLGNKDENLLSFRKL